MRVVDLAAQGRGFCRDFGGGDDLSAPLYPVLGTLRRELLLAPGVGERERDAATAFLLHPQGLIGQGADLPERGLQESEFVRSSVIVFSSSLLWPSRSHCVSANRTTSLRSHWMSAPRWSSAATVFSSSRILTGMLCNSARLRENRLRLRGVFREIGDRRGD